MRLAGLTHFASILPVRQAAPALLPGGMLLYLTQVAYFLE